MFLPGRLRGVLIGLFVGSGLVTSTGACGPSVQFIYEGNIRFEHCYRLDYDANIAPSHRKACWEDWLQRFPRGQTRDRLEYAKRRVDSLAGGERSTLNLNLVDFSDAGIDANSPAGPLPAPTNAHSPPPARMPPESTAALEGSGGAASTTAVPSSNAAGGSTAQGSPSTSARTSGSGGTWRR